MSSPFSDKSSAQCNAVMGGALLVSAVLVVMLQVTTTAVGFVPLSVSNFRTGGTDVSDALGWDLPFSDTLTVWPGATATILTIANLVPAGYYLGSFFLSDGESLRIQVAANHNRDRYAVWAVTLSLLAVPMSWVAGDYDLRVVISNVLLIFIYCMFHMFHEALYAANRTVVVNSPVVWDSMPRLEGWLGATLSGGMVMFFWTWNYFQNDSTSQSLFVPSTLFTFIGVLALHHLVLSHVFVTFANGNPSAYKEPVLGFLFWALVLSTTWQIQAGLD